MFGFKDNLIMLGKVRLGSFYRAVGKKTAVMLVGNN